MRWDEGFGRGAVQGGPGATCTTGDMGKVCNDESAVVRCLALYSDTPSSRTVGVEGRGGVYAHVYLIILCLEQSILLCLL